MVGGPTGGKARVEGAAVEEGAAVVGTLSPPSIPPEEHLVALVDTAAVALEVVKCEVERRELFTKKRSDGFLPKHEGKDGSTVVASNVWNREQLKNLNLCGKDVTNTFVLLDEGKTKLLGDFIRELDDPEAVKTCLQGLVYNSDTKFYKKGEEVKNSALLDFLNKDEISSEYKGNVNDLVQVASLVEPPLKRFTDLLIPSEGVPRPEYAEAGDTVEAVTPSARRVGEPQPAGVPATVGPDNASVGQGVWQEQPNISELPASRLNIPVEDQVPENALSEFSRFLNEKAQFIRREVSPSEEADSANVNIKSTEDDDVELVKAWLRKQFRSEPFGVISEVVSEGSSESETAARGDRRSNEDSAEEFNDKYRLYDFDQYSHREKSKEEFLSYTKERWKRERTEGFNNGNTASKMKISAISDDSWYIDPCSQKFEEGLIDSKLIDQFYEVKVGIVGDGYDITELAQIEINKDVEINERDRTFTVKSKGQLFLPLNHPYFTENPTPSS
jgi:hypothetical protein